MTTLNTLSALAAGALALAATGTATAQTPYGSSNPAGIPSSCRNAQTLENGYVSADCQADGGYRWSAIRTVDCRSALSNRNGVLTCTGATGTVGAMSSGSGYPTQSSQPTGATGVVGALLGALFGTGATAQAGVTSGDERVLDDDWSRGRRALGDRRGDLTLRIDAGVRDGTLSRSDADRLRADYDALVQLETRYGADGRFTTQERDELRGRYRALTQSVGEVRDDAYGRWEPLAGRRAEFDVRVDAALRDRAISRTEATRLRADYQALVQVETGYQRNGIDAREQADLQTRYDALSARLGLDDDGYGYDERNNGRWTAIEAHIATGERSGAIDRLEAARLRTELGDLTRLDAAYLRDGLDTAERDYLTRRYGELDARVRLDRR